MKTTFVPSGRYHIPSGVISSMTWDNPDLQAAIREAFSQRPGEQLTEIIVEQKGITALFEMGGE